MGDVVATLDVSRLDPEIQQALLAARLDALRLLSPDEREWFISLARARNENLEDAVRECLIDHYRMAAEVIDDTDTAAERLWLVDYLNEHPWRPSPGDPKP